MEKFFNTAGPQIPNDNYTIAPLARFNLDEILSLIRQQRYFVLHAPRQTGKTSCMLALRDYRIVLSNQDIVTGGSAFNIKAESLRLGNFSKDEIRELYMQHTRETGQQWDEACFPMVWEATEGHLIIFDRTKEKSWDERIWHKLCQFNGHDIMVWGM